jgi:hypothetical protein
MSTTAALASAAELAIDFDKVVKLFTGEHSAGLESRKMSVLKRLVRLSSSG